MYRLCLLHVWRFGRSTAGTVVLFSCRHKLCLWICRAGYCFRLLFLGEMGWAVNHLDSRLDSAVEWVGGRGGGISPFGTPRAGGGRKDERATWFMIEEKKISEVADTACKSWKVWIRGCLVFTKWVWSRRVNVSFQGERFGCAVEEWRNGGTFRIRLLAVMGRAW
ncbi:hypothetical protein EJ05DRAFT_184899 [Pseudovirgaria hyperparasitica]|uniref:Uncharacterized protein n=1 Tax=Pseudovirgaria hyperparasitica TaxID=470096 RepID=A0A6A6WI96_9PEZI|nr:uncharacterized protein EJ05DRAFT_184899 [Pseudovirgaria hyperparasitica]KAF2761780.1 hypothetical protein EJ05DRAFT_184899 [Pseudovirgaria hyperparasitica]